jgi:hypothetical protein
MRHRLQASRSGVYGVKNHADELMQLIQLGVEAKHKQVGEELGLA